MFCYTLKTCHQGLKSKTVYHHIVNLIYTDWVTLKEDLKAKCHPVTSCDNIPKEYWIPHTTQPPKIIYWNWSDDSKQTKWTAVLILRTKSKNWFYLPSSSEHIQPLHSRFKVSRYFYEPALWYYLSRQVWSQLHARAEKKVLAVPFLPEKVWAVASAATCPESKNQLIYLNQLNSNWLLLNHTATSILHLLCSPHYFFHQLRTDFFCRQHGYTWRA